MMPTSENSSEPLPSSTMPRDWSPTLPWPTSTSHDVLAWMPKTRCSSWDERLDGLLTRSNSTKSAASFENQPCTRVHCLPEVRVAVRYIVSKLKQRPRTRTSRGYERVLSLENGFHAPSAAGRR